MKPILIALVLIISGCSNSIQSTSNPRQGLIYAPKPIYPSLAISERKTGMVKVKYNVDDNGNTYDIKIIQEWPKMIFSESAKNVISDMKYVKGHPKLGLIFEVDYTISSQDEINNRNKIKSRS